MTQAARTRSAGEPAPLLLVCDDLDRGQALAAAIGHEGAPVFEATVIGGWEVVPADVVVLFEREPDLARTRRRLRFARSSRVIVVAWPDQHRLIELVLREQGTVITWPGDDARLAHELRRCLEERDGTVVVPTDHLADGLREALARRLHRSAPGLRLADATRIEALVEKLADAVLEEAREIDPTPLDAHEPREESAVVRKRLLPDAPTTKVLRPPPPARLPDLSQATTRPYAAVDDELAQLLASIELIEDEDEPATLDDDEPASVAKPPPLPPHPSVPALPPDTPERLGPPPWLAAAIVLGAGVFGFAATFWSRPDAPPPPTPSVAAPPRPILELGQPTVTNVEEPTPEVAAPGAAAPEGAAPEATLPDAPPDAATEAQLRAHRSAIRARAHRNHGRWEMALRAARFAVRLDPDDEGYRALLGEIEAESSIP